MSKQLFMKGNAMWYVKLNDTIIPTPYQYFSDCLAECNKLKETMVAVCTEPVFIN